MLNADYYSGTGSNVRLGEKIGQGGEATIYLIIGKKDVCAKIYHDDKLNKQREELSHKVSAMIVNTPEDQTWKSTMQVRSLAWPLDTLHADDHAANFVGFIMPYMPKTISSNGVEHQAYYEAHNYYDTESRISLFQGYFTWKHLLTAARNIASSVAAIHKQGHRVGDLNEQNILIRRSGLATLIDCDSFQICNTKSNEIYYSRVMKPEFLSPELFQNKSLDGIDRYYSDLFALGIIVFKFMMNGAHPYQATGPKVQDINTIEAMIQRGIYPYQPGLKDIEPPKFPFLPAYEVLPVGIQKMLTRCFVDGYSRPTSRPTAIEWVATIDDAIKQLNKCIANDNHYFANHLKNCPWCDMEKGTKRDPFPINGASESARRVDKTLYDEVLNSSIPSILEKIKEYKEKKHFTLDVEESVTLEEIDQIRLSNVESYLNKINNKKKLWVEQDVKVLQSLLKTPTIVSAAQKALASCDTYLAILSDFKGIFGVAVIGGIASWYFKKGFVNGMLWTGVVFLLIMMCNMFGTFRDHMRANEIVSIYNNNQKRFDEVNGHSAARIERYDNLEFIAGLFKLFF